MRCTLTPAYGRDYGSKHNAEKALLSDGHDFVLRDMSSPWDGCYVDAAQLRDSGYTVANVRYAKLRKIHPVDL